MTTVPLAQHPDVGHRESVLINPRSRPGSEIFRTDGRYLACLPGGLALLDTYASQAEAEAAQREWLRAQQQEIAA